MEQGGFTSFLNSRGLAVFMLIIALVIFGFLIANAVYFYNIKTDPNQSTVSQSDANTMMWINIVLSIIMFLFIVYYAAKSLTTANTIKQIKTTLEQQGNIAYSNAEKAYGNISDPLKQVYDAGVEAGKKAYASATVAAEQASKAAAAAYTAITQPVFIAPQNLQTQGKSTVYLYHQGGGVYKNPSNGSLYNCNGDICDTIIKV